MSVRSRPVAVAAIALFATLVARPVAAHVDYVTEDTGDPLDAVAFTVEVLSDPLNAAVFAGGGLVTVAGLAAYLWVRPTITDVVVLREKLAGYADLVPWMLRLAIGLPLVGAGFQGYLFAPTLTFDTGASPLLRVLFIGLGFFVLFGLATRIAATIGLLTYAWVVLSVDAAAVIAMEYVPVLIALVILGGGRPSADDMLLAVASTPGSYYGRIDPVHHLKSFLDSSTAPLRRYVPTVLRVGMGVTFVYLGLIEKLADPGRALLVVEKYDLTSVVPVDPGLWVVGAGVAEIAVGLALIAGFFTRGAAALSFVLFTTTLFGLPDDPVLAHVALFGMASAVFTLGSGPLSFDRLVGRPALDDEAVVAAD
ncbi:DoxX family protein [Halorubrum lipolyticum]|uniref:DoxX family protein n=1 Tax=Halorubrum lipolyticum DSM 21995 TaxID=1227482 RepID=M0NI37_9EURY|nr:DoxX family protein [Halorubrum lipolyticum]EMA57238.1 DoxX family protein [Halorubrum lipolyticum DSM 21995]